MRLRVRQTRCWCGRSPGAERRPGDARIRVANATTSPCMHRSQLPSTCSRETAESGPARRRRSWQQLRRDPARLEPHRIVRDRPGIRASWRMTKSPTAADASPDFMPPGGCESPCAVDLPEPALRRAGSSGALPCCAGISGGNSRLRRRSAPARAGRNAGRRGTAAVRPPGVLLHGWKAARTRCTCSRSGRNSSMPATTSRASTCAITARVTISMPNLPFVPHRRSGRSRARTAATHPGKRSCSRVLAWRQLLPACRRTRGCGGHRCLAHRRRLPVIDPEHTLARLESGGHCTANTSCGNGVVHCARSARRGPTCTIARRHPGTGQPDRDDHRLRAVTAGFRRCRTTAGYALVGRALEPLAALPGASVRIIAADDDRSSRG